MLLDIVTGSMLPIRAQLVYPLVYAFCLALITTIHIKPVSYIWCISAAIISLHQGQIMTQLFMVSHMTYEYDKATAVSICDDINEVSTEEGLDRFPVVFVGSKRPNLPSIYPKGDVIGYSFFEWDQDWYYGSM